MAMNECPNEELIAAMVAGNVHGKRGSELVQHILRCPRCRELAGKFWNLDALLACAHVGPDGTITVDEPKVTDDLASKLQEAAREAFHRKQKRRGRLRAFLEEVIEEISEAGAQPPGRPALVGYFATSPDEGRPAEEAPDPELREKFYDELTALLDLLLDLRIPLKERVAAIEELTRQLGTHLEGTS